MWAVIVHTVLVGTFAAFALGWNSSVWGFGDWNIFAGGFDTFRIAGRLARAPYVAGSVCFALVPLAIIACYRASMNKRAWIWLTAYWVLAATVWATMICANVAHEYRLAFMRYKYASSISPSGAFHFHSWSWLVPSLEFLLVVLLPLPVTVLAALLTIGAKKKSPAAAEAAA